MKINLPADATSVIIPVFIGNSSVTTGAGLGSLTEASSIVGGYVKLNGTGVALAVDEDVATEGTYQAPTTAAQVRIGTVANSRTGTYELHFHNDLFSSTSFVLITLGGASNMRDIQIECQVGAIDANVTKINSVAAVGTTTIDANVTKIGGSAQSMTDLKDFADDGYNPSTNKVTGVTLVDTVTTNTDKVTVADIWTGALTESYAADGAAATPAQLLHMIWSTLGDFSISGTTITCKKLDGTTTSMTYTIDDATNPTTRTRVT